MFLHAILARQGPFSPAYIPTIFPTNVPTTLPLERVVELTKLEASFDASELNSECRLEDRVVVSL